MRNDAVMRDIENNSMEVALEAFGKSIARWTGKGEQHTTSPLLVTFPFRLSPTNLPIPP